MKRDFVKYLASLLLFGTNGIMVMAINLPSHEIALARTSLGALLLVVLFVLGRGKLSLFKHPADLALAIASGASLGVCWIFEYLAFGEVGVAAGTLLYALGPVMVMALSPVLLKERLHVRVAVGFVVVVVGAALVNGPIVDATASFAGVLHGLASAVFYASMIVLARRMKTPSGLERSMVQMASAAVAVVMAIVVLRMPMHAPASSDVLPMLVLGFVNTGVGCYWYFDCIGKLPTQTVATCSYLEPLAAVGFSAAVLHEALVSSQWLGALLVIAGALYCELASSGRVSLTSLEKLRALPGSMAARHARSKAAQSFNILNRR